MPDFRQISKVRLVYDGDVEAMLPEKLCILDVRTFPDRNGKLNTPYLIYLQKPGYGNLHKRILRLVSGCADLDFTYDDWTFLGVCDPYRASDPNFATLWSINPEKHKKRPAPKAAPIKKKVPNPESVKARESANA